MNADVLVQVVAADVAHCASLPVSSLARFLVHYCCHLPRLRGGPGIWITLRGSNFHRRPDLSLRRRLLSRVCVSEFFLAHFCFLLFLFLVSVAVTGAASICSGECRCTNPRAMRVQLLSGRTVQQMLPLIFQLFFFFEVGLRFVALDPFKNSQCWILGVC